ncbi:MAG: UDP-N-acetylmuramate--L-alanine ligase, partial [Bacteroidales bacterium]|nr:UDP-N-acetylmuramate--L-alanine ligase [Bacteroidales bacterium]
MKRLFDDIEGVYFIGIGGIGMSALAEYFIRKNISVAGYDRTNTAITEMLIAQGCEISFEDDAETIPERFRTNR